MFVVITNATEKEFVSGRKKKSPPPPSSGTGDFSLAVYFCTGFLTFVLLLLQCVVHKCELADHNKAFETAFIVL